MKEISCVTMISYGSHHYMFLVKKNVVHYFILFIICCCMIVNLSSSLVHNNKNINNGCNSKNIDKKLLSMNQRSCTIQNVDDNDDITQQQHLNDNCVNGKEEKSIVYGHPTKTNSRRNFLSSLITSTTILATSSFNRRANAASIVEEEYPTTTAITPTPKSAPAAVTGSTTNNKLLPYTIDTANPNLIQYETAGMIPRIYFEEKRSIYGFVERVIDGDTIRVTHVPKFPIDGYIPEPIRKRGISDITISIRFYGVDAPETAKNKNQTSQPFGDDAKLFTSNNVYHQMVKITLLQKDKYGRAVGAVETISNPSKDLSIELAKRGLAELYTGGGAQYWTKKDQLVQAVTEAQKLKRGIWSLGDDFVSAAEQKRINRGESSTKQ